jgi:hypothetical protein
MSEMMNDRNLVCEYCGGRIARKDVRPTAWRLKYHSACKRTKEREARTRGIADPARPVCQFCGEPFTSARSHAKFCSTRCRTAAHRAG